MRTSESCLAQSSKEDSFILPVVNAASSAGAEARETSSYPLKSLEAFSFSEAGMRTKKRLEFRAGSESSIFSSDQRMGMFSPMFRAQSSISETTALAVGNLPAPRP